MTARLAPRRGELLLGSTYVGNVRQAVLGAILFAGTVLMTQSAAPAAENTITCRSNDGQVRIGFRGEQVHEVAIRLPSRGTKPARIWTMRSDEYVLELISQSGATQYPEGCDGVASGTVAIVRTEYLSTRRIRLTLPGGAFPDGVAGRTPEGDGLERDLTCSRVTTAMETCP